MAAVRSMHNVLGGVIDPHAASLLLRGMKTLGLRVAAQNATALEARGAQQRPHCMATKFRLRGTRQARR